MNGYYSTEMGKFKMGVAIFNFRYMAIKSPIFRLLTGIGISSANAVWKQMLETL